MITLDNIVDAYIECSHKVGSFNAEMILMKYLPDDKPEGKCYDVPEDKREAFYNELKAA
jgi:hypothetical protein